MNLDEKWLREVLAKGNVTLDESTKAQMSDPSSRCKVEIRYQDECVSDHDPWQPLEIKPKVIEVDKMVFTERKWTQPEIDFATNVLEPMLERGAIVFWTDQMEFRLPGQTYTADFVAMGENGEWYIYEVKGSYALGSQSRSSAKVRWLLDRLKMNAPVSVFWCKQKKDGTFKIREVVNKRRKHPMLKS